MLAIVKQLPSDLIMVHYVNAPNSETAPTNWVPKKCGDKGHKRWTPKGQQERGSYYLRGIFTTIQQFSSITRETVCGVGPQHKLTAK